MDVKCIHNETAREKTLSHLARLIMFVMALVSFACLQIAFAAFEPTGKLVNDETAYAGDTYIVGSHKIVLSRENLRVYRNAIAGDAVAQYEFAKVLNSPVKNGDASPRVAAEAVAWAMRSAEQGNADGENYVGMCYKEGDGVQKDAREGEKWFAKAVEHGSAKAMCNLAILYIEKGTPDKAVHFARKSAISGYAPGQFLWGKMNYQGQGVPMDAGKAVAWFMKARKQGDMNATSLLALCYQNGDGVQKDVAKAAELYEEVADKSGNMLQSTLAKVALASLYLFDKQAKGKALALKWAMEVLRDGGEQTLRRAGLGDHVATMQFIVGVSYYEGKCVKQNFELASEWLEKARAGGYAQADAMLARMANEQRKIKERELSAQKSAEEAEQRRLEEEARRIAEEEREVRRQHRKVMQREERARSSEDDEIRYQNEVRAIKFLQQHNPQLLNELNQLRRQNLR